MKLRLVVIALFLLAGCGTHGAPTSIPDDATTPSDASTGPAAPPPVSHVDAGSITPPLSPTGCGLHTGFPGDDACLPVPTDPAVIQLHYGPSSYEYPEPQFVLSAGGETTTCAVVMPSHGKLYLRSYEVSERTGMHHFSIYTGKANETLPAGDPCIDAVNFVFIAQQPHVRQTMGGGAPEYADAAELIAAGDFIVQAHALNTSTEPVLVEGWINLTTVASTTRPLSAIGFAAGHTMHVLPGTRVTIDGAAAASQPVPYSIIQLVSHFHEHTSEGRAYYDGKEIYRNDNWAEPTTTWFTSLTTGGPIVVQPAPKATDAGPNEGALAITPTTSISWQCDINNTTTGTLTFGNHAQTQEMCCLQGLVLGVKPWIASVP